MADTEPSFDPEVIREKLIETRRNEELAFIERMRAEIKANEEYISSLMANENFEH